ncbi:hypothetical protein Cni_G07794 [Canna indica]|uniref:Calmodulin-binding domain-containing protein n=1 Tax=Canna indica TaxID=4628 RepID=A0AAQ3Q7P5_9LILI|nr:hypothetical protein Cni_G07794 [Canna indica]
MVQRTAPANPCNKGGGGDARAKMKKARCSRMAELESERKTSSCSNSAPLQSLMPNYMKPTSCSDARKEQKKVTRLPEPSTCAAADRKRGRRNASSSTCSSACSSSQPVSGPKSVRVLLRKVSSKSLRLSMRRSLGAAPSPKPKVNRATCSSTLKDSRFPKGLELSPGGTEAEGTSAVKVCPYKYCSLNGHFHGDGELPPLKCFLASRRKMLKAQKCMKQKGVSPFRKQGSGKDSDATARTRSGLEISSLIEEIGGDFFVEIYAKSQEVLTESGKCDERSIRESRDNLNKCEDDEGNLVDGTQETSSDLSSEDDRDRSSELSLDDLEVMMGFLEYVSCDQEDGEADKEKIPSSMTEDCKEGKKVEADNQVEVLESIDINLEGDADPFSDDRSSFSDDELAPILGKLFEDDLGTKSISVTDEVETYHEEPKLPQDNDDSNSRCENISESTNVSEEKGEDVVVDQGSVIISDCELFEPLGLDSNRVLTDDNEKDEKLELCSVVQIPAFNQELLGNGTKVDDQMRTGADDEISDCSTDDLEVKEGHLGPNTVKNKEGKLIKYSFSNHSPTDDGTHPNLRMIITRKTRDEESDHLKEFNPRSPNFLPVEPDPESEKVDLKHQMMDERRNTEEWMIDYALQQAVTKLGPARRQKVALLVEAFETVLPVPAGRPLQAC